MTQNRLQLALSLLILFLSVPLKPQFLILFVTFFQFLLPYLQWLTFFQASSIDTAAVYHVLKHFRLNTLLSGTAATVTLLRIEIGFVSSPGPSPPHLPLQLLPFRAHL